MTVLLPVLILAAWSIPSAFGCDHQCNRYEYCDEYKNLCRNCSELCAEDEYTCFHKCQNYLFKSLSSFRTTVDKLESNVSTMWTILMVVGILAAVSICVALTLLALKYYSTVREFLRWNPQNKSTAPVGYTHENPNTRSPKVMPKNGANGAAKPTSTAVSIYPETEADTSVQTGTTSISHRYPAEDSTESYSYDNAALNVTPTSNNPMPKF